jgi:glycosyltransferase involved in cell wall biosynthesis
MSAPSPLISVVVIAHERRAFIRDAVSSVLSQTIDPRSFELIVVKDFEDSDIDRFLDSHRVRSVLTSELGQASKIAIGTREARGQVLCFLDDDDLFSSSKLAHVASRFLEIPDLTFYHNDYRLIDAAGQEIRRSEVRYHSRSTISRKHQLILSDQQKRTSLGLLSHTYPDYNNSSISIRREAVLSRLSALSAEIPSVDLFLFVCGVQAKGSLLVDDQVLTSIRLHSRNLSFVPASDPREFFRAQVAARDRFAPGYLKLRKLAEDGGPHSLVRSIEGTILMNQLYGIIQGKTGGRGGAARTLVKLLPLSRTYTVRAMEWLLPFSLFFAVSPALARTLFYRYMSRG